MTVTIISNDNYVMCSIPLKSTLPQLNNWIDFVKQVLRYAVDKKQIYLFTLSPQKYSLGYEFGSFEQSSLGHEKILINHFQHPTDDLLSDVANSEEFNRGLLKIVLSDKKKVFNNLAFIQGDYTNVKEELITLEDDGLSFYWYNPHLPNDQIKEKLQELKRAKIDN